MHAFDVTEGLQRDEGKDKHNNENHSNNRKLYTSDNSSDSDSFCFSTFLCTIMTGHWFRMK